MSASRRIAEPVPVVVLLTLLATWLRIDLVDAWTLNIVAIPVLVAALLFADYIGISETGAGASAKGAVGCQVGLFASAYILVHRLILHGYLRAGSSEDALAAEITAALPVVIAAAFLVTFFAMAIALRRSIFSVASLSLVSVGSLALPIVLMDSLGERLRWWTLQVTPANPLCLWASIACCCCLSTLVRLNSATLGARSISDARFTAGLMATVGVAIGIAAFARVWPATAYTNPAFSVHGIILVIAAAVLLHKARRVARHNQIPSDVVTYRA